MSRFLGKVVLALSLCLLLGTVEASASWRVHYYGVPYSYYSIPAPVYAAAPVYTGNPVFVPSPAYVTTPVYAPRPIYTPAPAYAPVYVPSPAYYYAPSQVHYYGHYYGSVGWPLY
jgi:hypothetical protein